MILVANVVPVTTVQYGKMLNFSTVAHATSYIQVMFGAVIRIRFVLDPNLSWSVDPDS
jgi:hypothetical protein